MIRAMVSNGVIKPLEPLPADWQNGHEVLVDDLREQPPSDAVGVDIWLEEMKALTAELNDAEEWQAIEAGYRGV